MVADSHLTTSLDTQQEQERLDALREQWNLMFQDSQDLIKIHVPDDEKLLFERSQALANAWTKFQLNLPAGQQQKYKDQPPSLRALFEAVNKASNTWQEKRDGTKVGRLRKIFDRLCISCDNHSHALEMIPKNDKYVCLLTGSLTTIVQATVNHVKIAEGVSQSLEKLVADIAFWSEQMELYKDNLKMLEILRELYVVVFEFLTNVFNKWSSSSWDRFLKSFDKNFFDREFEARQSRMDELSKRLERQARLQDQRKFREMEMKIYEKFNVLEKGLLPDPEAESGLPAGGIENNPQQNYPRLASQGASTRLLDTSSGMLKSNGTGSTLVYHKIDITEALCSHGLPQPGSTALMKEASLPSFLSIDMRVLERLQNWMRAPGPDNIWIHGPSRVDLPSQNTLTARALVAAARMSDIPLIQYFAIDAITETAGVPDMSPSRTLVKFLQGLIVQFAMVLPNSFSSDCDLTKAHLARLMEPQAEPGQDFFKDILDVSSSLRQLLPPTTLCVVDGLQALENRSDKECTEYLYRTLNILYNRRDDKPTVPMAMAKVCFTTDGYVDALALGVEEGKLDKILYEEEAHEETADDAAEVDNFSF